MSEGSVAQAHVWFFSNPPVNHIPTKKVIIAWGLPCFILQPSQIHQLTLLLKIYFFVRGEITMKIQFFSAIPVLWTPLFVRYR
jgi:hypothetical protein